MQYEHGVVTGGPVRVALLQVVTVFKTWLYAKRNRVRCNKWYGVYEKGAENIVCSCGPLPGAAERSQFIAESMNKRQEQPMKKQKRFSGDPWKRELDLPWFYEPRNEAPSEHEVLNNSGRLVAVFEDHEEALAVVDAMNQTVADKALI